MLPRVDDTTLSRYLLSVAEAINRQVNQGLTGDSTSRLRECATIVARVSQQIEARAGAADRDAPAEAEALEAGEAAFAEAEARRATAGLGEGAASERRIARAELEAYLRCHPLGGPDLRLTEARLLPGGRCKLTALVSQAGSEQLPASFILRQDWRGGATNTTVAKEFSLLQRVVAGGVRAPHPLLMEPDEAVLGAPFVLLERMRGGLAGGLFTPPRSRTLGLQLAAQLGRLHALPADDFEDFRPELPSTPERLQEVVPSFRHMQATIGIESRIIDAAIDWLEDHLAHAGSGLCLTHNDVGFHNSLVDGEELTAILDWELAQLGHPAADLGYIKHFIELMMPWPEFMEAYVAAGGWRMPADTLRFHTIWNAVRLYGLIMQARANLAAGLVSDVEITFACADNLMLLIRFVGRELYEASLEHVAGRRA